MKPIYFVICIQIICVCSFFNLAHANERIFLTSVNDKIFIENAILSKPTNFWNELENGLCFLLSVDSQDIGYVSSIQKTKSKTILYMCNEYDDKSENSETSKYGEIGKPVQLLLKGNSWNTEGIDYPDSQFWPYGTYCNDYFAYWGIKPNGDFFANVYDLT
jgi:hypothetical protein